MTTLLLFVGWMGCATPGQADAEAYVRGLQPLLVENAALADQVLLQGAAIYNDAAGPKDVAAAWEKRIVPMAEHLAAQASFAEPPPPYAGPHGELVKIWTDRATAYRGMSEATRTANADLWNAARAKVDEVHAQEHGFFNELNVQLSPMGLQVDPYP
jgi:hypothetical protein